jgi:hypothetical protein
MPIHKPHVSHYGRGAIQPIDFMESNFTPDEYRGYLKGQVIKYISRYQYKGKPIADLAKAQTYLAWLIEFEGGIDERREKTGRRNHSCKRLEGIVGAGQKRGI